ncbi:hypothetical protein DICVIV_09897 [Dictyocaulus viviparus]|uniref:G-protein coupled receptors family 1 profile domain-containing protein n=1 Tax=Dictyocaulus viviparus TaxID=29172 RepID=A0A0D8XK12_DICVI|nr:hypothetical protein DICVIV_09897 [Dictyocaulus viviparus]
MSQKLRSTSLYMLFCHLSVINVLDLSFSVVFSIIFIANDSWILGEQWCRVNTSLQEFCQIYIMLILVLMSVERAAGLEAYSSTPGKRLLARPQLLDNNRSLVFFFFLGLASFAIAFPTATKLIPVKPFKNRFLCAIDSGVPVGYTLTRIALYIGCLIVVFVCVSQILKRKVVFLVIIFILLEGPYLSFSFIFEICNSSDHFDEANIFNIPQEAHALITCLKFLFPLLSPTSILCWCSDISGRVKELCCCCTHEQLTITPLINKHKSHISTPEVLNVVTIGTTTKDIQLNRPTSTPIDSVKVQYII